MKNIKEFIVFYAADCRIRHCLKKSSGKILEFCVQLEINYKGHWTAIVRYDTAHGFAHRDIIHANGRQEKFPLGLLTYNEALTFAQTDLDKNWRFYHQNFLKEAGQYD